jgi:PAS domain S-box-containing protein
MLTSQQHGSTTTPMRRFFRGIRPRTIALGSLPLAFMFLVLGCIAWLQHDTQSAIASAQHSDNVLDRVKDFDKTLTEATTAASSYVFIGDASQLTTFRQLVPKIAQTLAQLRFLVRDNPAQIQRWDNLKRSTQTSLATLDRYIALAELHDQAGINQLIVSELKKSQKDSVTERQLEFEDAESLLRNERLARVRQLWHDLDLLLIFSVVLGIFFTLSLNSLFGRQIVNRLQALARNVRRFSLGDQFDLSIHGNDEITDLERAYRDMVLQVRQSEQSLTRNLLARHSRDIMFFVRRSDVRILEANQAACDAYGYNHQELTQLSAYDLRVVDERERAREDIERAETFNTLVETIHVRKDRTTFPVEISAHSTEFKGEDVVLCVVRDIGERTRASQTVEVALRQATEASRLKSEFVATMSHEIRTPMNGVIGTTDLLLRTDLNQQQHGYALTIRQSGDALLRVINDILDFSKMEAGKMELDIAEFDIVLVVESVASLLTPQAHKKLLSLMTFVDPAIPSRLIGDADRLRQVLLNLAGNAIKFTEAGNVLISAALKPTSTKHVRIEFSVSDTGMGLTPESQARLFEPFHQLDGSPSRRHGGTGLGLSISQQLVHLMGGSIGVQSALGKGAVFSFRVSLVAASAKPHGRLVPSKSPHVLIIDDDAISRDVISRYLGAWKMTYEIAVDAGEALTQLDRSFTNGKSFDLAIVDLARPHIEGFALGEKIRSDGRFNEMRLLLVTADDKPEPTGASQAGFSAYLVKPLKQSHLYDCIVDATFVPVSPELPAGGALEPPLASELHILVAEDNSINRELALQQLEILGYAAIAVENGKKAVESAAKFEYDIILMDCQMPEMDGFDATRAIRRLEARSGKRCRIIAMTANALSSDRLRCIEAGMDDYISKPVTLERLQEALQATAAPGMQDAADAASDGERPEVLNVPRLQQIFSDRAAIGPFLQSALPVLEEMVQRLASCATCDEGAAVVHELKGAAANLGAVALSSAAASLERKILAGNMDSAGIANTKKALDELAEAIGYYESIPA